MHVIIGGFGRVGRNLAHVLESQGHSVTVIDHDPRAFAEHGESIRGRKLTGEVFDRDTLIKAGIEQADAFAAVTTGDNSNIVSARIARERFGVALRRRPHLRPPARRRSTSASASRPSRACSGPPPSSSP